MIMVLALALLLSLVMWIMAAIHVFWGFGGVWPARDGQGLAKAVVGRNGITRMPSPLACFAVAGVLFGVGCWPLAMAGALPNLVPHGLMVVFGWGFVAVFFARAAIVLVPAISRRFSEQPFRWLNRLVYAPLCFLLGMGFLMLLQQG